MKLILRDEIPRKVIQSEVIDNLVRSSRNIACKYGRFHIKSAAEDLYSAEVKRLPFSHNMMGV